MNIQYKEVTSLPILEGTITSSDKFAIDKYLVNKSNTTKASTIWSLNKVAIIFDYKSYLHTPWSQIKYEHFRTLILILPNEHDPNSVNVIIRSLRGVLKTANELKLISTKELQKILRIKMLPAKRSSPFRLNHSEIIRLTESCIGSHNNTINTNKRPAAFRDLAILCLSYICGFRRKEISRLQTCDINLNLQYVRIIGKNESEYFLNLDDATVRAIKLWLDFRGHHNGALINPINKGGNIHLDHISEQSVYNIQKKRLNEAGISNITNEEYKNSFISIVLNRTNEIICAHQ